MVQDMATPSEEPTTPQSLDDAARELRRARGELTRFRHEMIGEVDTALTKSEAAQSQAALIRQEASDMEVRFAIDRRRSRIKEWGILTTLIVVLFIAVFSLKQSGENGQVATNIQTVVNTLQDCLDSNGVCAKRNQETQASLVGNLNAEGERRSEGIIKRLNDRLEANEVNDEQTKLLFCDYLRSQGALRDPTLCVPRSTTTSTGG